MSSLDWSTLREGFSTLNHNVYLNSCSLGLLHQRGRDAANRFLDLWSEHGASAWYGLWLSELANLRREFALLIGAEEGEIALVPSVSAGLGSISSSLDFSERNRVVVTELDFPTVAHHFHAMSPRGVETFIVRSSDRISVSLADFEEAITDRTALVATSRVYFTSGYIQDVRSLSEICHRHGALLLVDDYQATGQLSIDVKTTGVDFLLTGGLKWLLGGPGMAYMYVKRELISNLIPTLTGWFGHRDQFEFNPESMVYKTDARRFESGTPSVSAAYIGAAGLSLVNEIGVQEIRRRTREITKDLTFRLEEGGFQLRIPKDPDHHASITMVDVLLPQSIVMELSKRGITVDSRPGGVRISPYFYNNKTDNERLDTGLQEIREQFPAWFYEG